MSDHWSLFTNLNKREKKEEKYVMKHKDKMKRSLVLCNSNQTY
jgi:hypothetical protein